MNFEEKPQRIFKSFTHITNPLTKTKFRANPVEENVTDIFKSFSAQTEQIGIMLDYERVYKRLMKLTYRTIKLQ